MTKKKIVFLIPALNEEKGIGQTIKSIPKKSLESSGYNVDIVIVDGHSTDGTVRIAKQNRAKVIVSERGYGRQYKYALSKIKGDMVITGDADGTYPFSTAPKLIMLLEKNNFDFINTNRFFSLKQNSMSFSHYFGNKLLTFLTNILFGLHLKDSQSGMWCFRLDKVRKLKLTDNSMAFSEEIKIKAFRKLKCTEVGIAYKKRLGESKLNYRHAFENMLFLFKLRVFP